MTMKVGRRGLVAVAVMGAATLVSTSTAAAVAAPPANRTLKLRLSGPGPVADLEGFQNASAHAWVIRGSGRQALRAAHALLGEEDLGNGDVLVRESRLIVVRVRVGPQPRRRVLTNARTVGDLLEALEVSLGDRDAVRPGEGERLRPRAMIEVTRVRRVRKTVVEDVPFQTLIQYSRALAPGEVRVATPGEPGRALSVYLVTYRNGRRTSAKLVSQRVQKEPVNRVEIRGPVEPAASGRPPVGGTGVEYGQATWYECPGLHAAHRTLPFGTPVTVVNLDNGATVTVTINDRGPYAEGRIIDLCDDAFAQIAPLGQGVAEVKITY